MALFGLGQQKPHHYRGIAKIIFRGADHVQTMIITLDRCLLTKLKAPALNGKDGAVAVEELQLTYESMSLGKEGISG
jgi:hypothetical protein